MTRILRHFVAVSIFLAAFLTVAAPAPRAAAESAADAAAIEQTIRSQIAAIQQDDWAKAFTYASPMIQGIFETPENFSRMVRGGYPMVWRPRSFRAGDLTDGDRGIVQVMFFEDQDGRLFIADYFMKLVDGEWRINGVQIRPAPEQSA